MSALLKLKHLGFSGCKKLATLPSLASQEILSKLALNGCDGLQALPALPTTFDVSELEGKIPNHLMAEFAELKAHAPNLDPGLAA